MCRELMILLGALNVYFPFLVPQTKQKVLLADRKLDLHVDESGNDSDGCFVYRFMLLIFSTLSFLMTSKSGS